MSLPIILSTSGVDWKGDSHGSGQIKLLDQNGKELRSVVRSNSNLFEMGQNQYDVSEVISNIIDVSSPAASTKYNSSTIRATIDGFDVITFCIIGTGTGIAAFEFDVEASLDGITWFNSPWHETYVISPVNGATKEGFIEIRTAFPFIRCSVITESSPMNRPTNIIVHAIRSLKHSTGTLRHPISMNLFGDGINNDSPHSRGVYEVDMLVSGNTTSNYVYFAIFNPPTASTKIVLESLHLDTQNVSNTNVTTLRSLDMISISSLTGGTSQVPTPQKSTYPPSFAISAQGNPTVTAGNVMASWLISDMNGNTVEQSMTFSPGMGPILNPGEGWALRPNVALTNNDRISLHAVFKENC